MRSVEYEYLNKLEDSMWWFKGLRGNVVEILSQRIGGRFSLLDAGCGTGGMLHTLAERFTDAMLYGIDISVHACELCRGKSAATIQCGSVTSLPYKDRFLDVVTSLDVLEYDSVNMVNALQEFRRCLKNNGLLLLNLPAYQWMISYHDLAVGQARRFTLRGLERELTKYGFNIIYGTYWNTIAFPLMVLRRKLFVRKDGGSDVKQFPAFIEWMFLRAMRVERAIIKNKWQLPFGGSVLVLAERTP